MKVPSTLSLRGKVDLEAPLDAELAAKRPRAVKMNAYTGARVSLGFVDLILDLAGFAQPKRPPVLLQQHDPTKIVGLATEVVLTETGLEVGGRLYKTKAGKEVADLADDGFPWQSSVGAKMSAVTYVEEGQQVQVNGRLESGPFLHAERWTIHEASFVPLGADDNTQSAVLAQGEEQLEVQIPEKETKPMSATIAELKAAFPNELEFVLDQAEKGSTLDQAKLNYLPVVQARLAAAEAKLQTQTAPLPDVPAGTATLSTTTGAQAPTILWPEAVDLCLKECNGDRPKATRLAALRYPEARQVHVQSYNQNHKPRS